MCTRVTMVFDEMPPKVDDTEKKKSISQWVKINSLTNKLM